MPSIRVYATPVDWRGLLSAVESRGRLTGVEYGPHLIPDPEVLGSIGDIPRLGLALDPDSIGCESYVVVEPELKIAGRPVRASDGVTRYYFDQLENPDSIMLRPAGFWAERTLICGNVGTVSNSPLSKSLLNRFRRAIRNSCTNLYSNWIADDAMRLFDSGWRLTLSARMNPAYDLRRV